MCTTIGTYYSFYMTVCCPGWIGTPIWSSNQVGVSLHESYIKLHFEPAYDSAGPTVDAHSS
jgi:hypothetical protein